MTYFPNRRGQRFELGIPLTASPRHSKTVFLEWRGGGPGGWGPSSKRSRRPVKPPCPAGGCEVWIYQTELGRCGRGIPLVAGANAPKPGETHTGGRSPFRPVSLLEPDSQGADEVEDLIGALRLESVVARSGPLATPYGPPGWMGGARGRETLPGRRRRGPSKIASRRNAFLRPKETAIPT